MQCLVHLLASASTLQIEVLYTGSCSAEHLIGSTDDKGCWLDGLLVRRLRALVEGMRGGAYTTAKRSRHRACGVGTGDVCLPPAGKATSGFSHGCKSRLLVLDGPISRVLEGILASDRAGGPSLTGPEVTVESPLPLDIVAVLHQIFLHYQRSSMYVLSNHDPAEEVLFVALSTALILRKF